ncbi:MAG: aspartate/glutamate racemase family protein [Pseudomonas sp.]|uniref:aspartate/glutamate racemase family protein n=1 Tax=Pseudomonas sp. TaxID=306 RepID=UPI003D14971F
MTTQASPRKTRGADKYKPDRASDSAGIVGILGGMGPLATIDFMRKMLEATPATTDQDHVPVVVSSIPQVPDRTLAFRGEGASPLEAMLHSGRRLVDAGAGLVVIPCNTAHLWYDAVQQSIGLPMLHLVDAALEDALALTGGTAPIGLLATDATLASGLYLNRSTTSTNPTLRVQWLLPTAGEMLNLVMPGIAAVKAGQVERATELLAEAAMALGKRGAQALILGCTEIPVALSSKTSPLPAIDATKALANRAVAWSAAQRQTHGH